MTMCFKAPPSANFVDLSLGRGGGGGGVCESVFNLFEAGQLYPVHHC